MSSGARRSRSKFCRRLYDEKVGRLKRGDEFPPGVIKLVKVYIAMKRKIRSATRWRVGTAIRVSSPESCPKKICRICRTERRSRSS